MSDLLKEVLREEALRRGLIGPSGDQWARLEDETFPKQREFILDQSPRSTLCTPRRAAKTETVSRKLLRTAKKKPGSKSVYISMTRDNAKRNIWGRLQTMVARYSMGLVPNHSELILRDPSNRSEVWITGLATEKELAKLRGNSYDYVHVDECFPAGTMIDGRPIETLAVGDAVRSYDEVSGEFVRRPIRKVWVTKAKDLVRIRFSSGVSTVCTANHPFLTDHGWTKAVDLQGQAVLACDDDMQMRQDIPAQPATGLVCEEDRMHASLLAKMPTATELAKRGGETGAVRAHAARQPDIEAGCPSQNDCDPKTARGLAAQGARRQRIGANHPATEDGGPLGTWLGTGVSGHDRVRTPASPLPDRYRERHAANRDRDRWTLPQLEETPGWRHAEGPIPRWDRVDRVEVLQPGSDEERESLCPGGVVYNLHVEGTLTYIVGGHVVHNCQDILIDFESFIMSVILPALGDRRGILSVSGTPDPWRRNQWWYQARNSDHPRWAKWKRFGWLLTDNIFFPEPEKYLAEIRESEGYLEDDPRYQAEYLGLWVSSKSNLCIDSYEPSRNDFTGDPSQLPGYEYLLGLDPGYKDATGYVVMAYSTRRRHMLILESQAQPNAIASDIAATVQAYLQKYPISRVVCDEQGMGKTVAVELVQRFSLPIVPAEKKDKRMRLAFLNSDLRVGRLQVVANRNLALIGQWNSVMWDAEHQREMEGQVCDLFDASGYAHMECRSFFDEEPAAQAISEGDAYWAEKIERARAEREGWEFDGDG